MHHLDVLNHAKHYVTEHAKLFGDPQPSFQKAANIASAMLDRRVAPFECAVIMMAIRQAELSAKKDDPEAWAALCSNVAVAGQFSVPSHSADYEAVVTATVESDLSAAMREINNRYTAKRAAGTAGTTATAAAVATPA